MPAEKADHTDAELILRLYDLRREAVMRDVSVAVDTLSRENGKSSSEPPTMPPET